MRPWHPTWNTRVIGASSGVILLAVEELISKLPFALVRGGLPAKAAHTRCLPQGRRQRGFEVAMWQRQARSTQDLRNYVRDLDTRERAKICRHQPGAVPSR